jgi:hypothetical protein
MFKEIESTTTGCGCSGGPAKIESAAQETKKQVKIEFLYLDLSVCDKCQSTEANLDEALSEIERLLKNAGVEVSVEKIHVRSLEQARHLGFVSSPTIRVNDKDLQFGVKENYCAKCSELSGTETNCRVWKYQGQNYSAAPKPLIIETILSEVYGSRPDKPSAENEKDFSNIERFFASKN